MVEFSELKEVRESVHELLKVHGAISMKKAEDIIRLIYENLNGINNRISNNDKLDKAKQVIDDLGADIVAYNEHWLNLKDKVNVNGLAQMFWGGEADVMAVGGHNVHENVGRVQEGGIALLAFEELIEQFDFDNSGCEDLGLGRWTVTTAM